MTAAEAHSLHPGDRIRLKPQPTWATNPPQRTTFVVARVDFRPGFGDPRILSVEGFAFVPWEIERVEWERRP